MQRMRGQSTFNRPSRIDLASVGRIFEAAPDEVEISGKLVKK